MTASKIKFLIPVAFSPQSEIIIEQACNLARYYDADITMLYVLDTSRIKGLFSNNDEEKILLENAQKKFGDYVQEAQKKYQLNINSLVIEGRTYETIVSVARSIEANFIIMGATGASGFKSQFVGTNTMRTIKHAPCPVITIKGKTHRHGCNNILLPLDLTKDTTQKIEYAIEFAKMFGDATVRIVSVVWENEFKVIESLKEQMYVAREKVQTAGVECTAEFVKIIKSEDTFSEAVIAYGEKVEADVIMIMTQQESNPTEFFVGSSAQSIITKSDIPVMSILPKGMSRLQIF